MDCSGSRPRAPGGSLKTEPSGNRAVSIEMRYAVPCCTAFT